MPACVQIARNVELAASGTAQVAIKITDVNRGAGETGFPGNGEGQEAG